MKRICLFCGEEIAETKKPIAVYCSLKCKIQAKETRRQSRIRKSSDPKDILKVQKWNATSRKRRRKNYEKGLCIRCSAVNDCYPLKQCSKCGARERT